jgi:hypothetical protein
MVRRANAYDPLEATSAPRWHVVRTMRGSLVESHPLAPGADLTRFFRDDGQMDRCWLEDRRIHIDFGRLHARR